jgi:tetratricopeptide (TPR) repeat protein
LLVLNVFEPCANPIWRAGNELLKIGNPGEGGEYYNCALEHCFKCYDPSAREADEITQIRLSLFLNLGLCAAKQEDWDLAVEYSTKAIAIDNANVKALCRRAKAYEKTGQSDEAMTDLLQAAKMAPERKYVTKAILQMKKAQKSQDAAERSICRRMFRTSSASSMLDPGARAATQTRGQRDAHAFAKRRSSSTTE